MDYHSYHLQNLLLDTSLCVQGQKWGCASFSSQFLACHVPTAGKLVQYSPKPASSRTLDVDKSLSWFMAKSTASESFFPHPGKFKSQASYPYIVFWSNSLVHVFKQVQAANHQLQLSTVAELKFEDPVVFVHLTSLHTLYILFQTSFHSTASSSTSPLSPLPPRPHEQNECWIRGYYLNSSPFKEMDVTLTSFTLASSISCCFATLPIHLHTSTSLASNPSQAFTLFLGTFSGHLYHVFVKLETQLIWELKLQAQFEPHPIHFNLHPQGWLLAIVYQQGSLRLCDLCFQPFHFYLNAFQLPTLDLFQWVCFQTHPVFISWAPSGTTPSSMFQSLSFSTLTSPSSSSTSTMETMVIVFDRGPLLVLQFPIVQPFVPSTYVHLLVAHQALDPLRTLIAHSTFFSSFTFSLFHALMLFYRPHISRTHVQNDVQTWLALAWKLPFPSITSRFSFRGHSHHPLLPFIRKWILELIHFQLEEPALHLCSVYECMDFIELLKFTTTSTRLRTLCSQLLLSSTSSSNPLSIPSIGFLPLDSDTFEALEKKYLPWSSEKERVTFGKTSKKYAIYLECHQQYVKAKAQWSKMHYDRESQAGLQRLMQLETYLRKAPKAFTKSE